MRQVLTDLFVEPGAPGHIRSDYGPVFVAKVVRGWLGRGGVTTLVIEPGSPLGERGGTTTPSGRTAPWAIGRQRRTRCCRGRLAPPRLRSGRAMTQANSLSPWIPDRGQVSPVQAKVGFHRTGGRPFGKSILQDDSDATRLTRHFGA